MGLTLAAFPVALAILYQPTGQFLIRIDERMLEITVALVFAVVILHLRGIDHRVMTNRLLVPISFCGTMCYSVLVARLFFLGVELSFLNSSPAASHPSQHPLKTPEAIVSQQANLARGTSLER